MRTFDVTVEFTAIKTYRIKAKDEATARQLAKAKASDVSETWQDSHNTTSIEECEEVFTLPKELDFTGGMITFNDEGTARCLGYLIDFKEKGVFDATYGKVPVTPEQAALHNEVFDAANIKGLDGCGVGQGGQFYKDDDSNEVKTFLGTVVGICRNPSAKAFFREDRRYEWKRMSPRGEGSGVFVTRVG